MCGCYTNTKAPAEIEERFGVPIPLREGTRRYNIAPTEDVLAIVAPKGEPEARLLRWGLIPSWATDMKGAYKMINARVETVASTPAYRVLIPKASRRARSHPAGVRQRGVRATHDRRVRVSAAVDGSDSRVR